MLDASFTYTVGVRGSSGTKANVLVGIGDVLQERLGVKDAVIGVVALNDDTVACRVAFHLKFGLDGVSSVEGYLMAYHDVTGCVIRGEETAIIFVVSAFTPSGFIRSPWLATVVMINGHTLPWKQVAFADLKLLGRNMCSGLRLGRAFGGFPKFTRRTLDVVGVALCDCITMSHQNAFVSNHPLKMVEPDMAETEV